MLRRGLRLAVWRGAIGLICCHAALGLVTGFLGLRRLLGLHIELFGRLLVIGLLLSMGVTSP